jgi:ParB family chromosome partitioning protein
MTTKNKSKNPFKESNEALGTGVDSLFNKPDSPYSLIPLDMIELAAQIREELEDEDNPLSGLSESIKKHGVMQPITVRPTSTGYLVISGERRYRASIMAELDAIPAIVKVMSDDEAEDAQLAENIHRKNLTQIEEAKKIQRDLDLLGSVEAVLNKHNKSHAWLSKRLSLLTLPEQAKRLVSENISDDIEVINAVKTIEKLDSAKAKELVDDLKLTRGKEVARTKVLAVKEEVKPSKKVKEPESGKLPNSLEKQSDGNNVFADAKISEPLEKILAKVYMDIYNLSIIPKTVLKLMTDEDKANVEAWLRSFYDLGRQCDNTSRGVVQGFRNRKFSSSGNGALALVAYLHGASNEDRFSLLNILSDVKP